MPFTIGGEWFPEPSPSKPKHPIKVVKEKRRSSFVTLILHLSEDGAQLKSMCSTLKQKLGCGGSVKEGQIELQGDQVQHVKSYLREMGIRISDKP